MRPQQDVGLLTPLRPFPEHAQRCLNLSTKNPDTTAIAPVLRFLLHCETTETECA
jgi:hypothetical protein